VSAGVTPANLGGFAALSAPKEMIMSSNKQLRPDEQPVELQDDLERNPGIGSSEGLFARESGDDAGLIEGDNTMEGDVENDGMAAGGVGTKLGRTNK
jgi:hypothetical protein